MIALLILLLRLLVSPARPKWLLEAENAALKHQLAILQRKDAAALESGGLSSVLALEIQELRRAANHLSGIADVNPADAP